MFAPSSFMSMSLQIRIGDFLMKLLWWQAFYNWAIAISDRAKMRGRTNEAEELWKQVDYNMRMQSFCCLLLLLLLLAGKDGKIACLRITHLKISWNGTI